MNDRVGVADRRGTASVSIAARRPESPRPFPQFWSCRIFRDSNCRRTERTPGSCRKSLPKNSALSPNLENFRGGTGDVRHCWRAFREAGFRWICGVAGNHDSFGDGHEFQEFLSQRDICFLDGRVVELDGLKIAGISGVMGNPRRLFRRKSEVFLRTIEEVVAKRPDVLVLHEGPSAEPESTFPGQKVIRQTLETLPPTFVLFGHSHWESAEARSLANGTQVINVDARAHLLVPSNRSVRRHDR